MKLLRYIPIFSLLALAGLMSEGWCSPVTVAVTQANPEGDGIITASTDTIIRASTPSDTPEQPIKVTNWHPAIFVVLNGGRYTFTRSVGFITEAECKTHLGSQEFMAEVTSIAAQVLSQDENASMAGEPACVERAAPSKGA